MLTSPILFVLFCFNFCNSLPIIDQNPKKKLKLYHHQPTHLIPHPLQSTQQTNNLPNLLLIQHPQDIHSLPSIHNFPRLQSTPQLRSLPRLISTQRSKSLPSLISNQQPNNLPPLISTQQPVAIDPLQSTHNFPRLHSNQRTNSAPQLISTQPNILPPLVLTRNSSSLKSNLEPNNEPLLQSAQQPKSLPPPYQKPPFVLTVKPNSVFTKDLPSDQGRCGVCIVTLYPDCYQCLSLNENTSSHEFCINCIVRTKKCPLCKAPVTLLHHYMVLLKMKSKCDNSNKYHAYQSCLWKLLRDTISTIANYPEIRSNSEEIVKYCILNLKCIDNMVIELILWNYNVLSIELFDYLIQTYGIKESYSDYIVIMIKKCFGVKIKRSLFDMDRIISLIKKYGNVSDYSKYNSQAINSSLQWTMPNLSAVTLFITRFRNQLSDHELFYKSALEASIRNLNINASNQLILHFGVDKNDSWIRSTFLDVITYSFHIRNFALIEPIIKKHVKKDELIDYLKLIIENMVKYSITTQTNGLINEFSKQSDLPILVNHAIIHAIQESKIDVVKFMIYTYGNQASYKVYIISAIHISILSSQFNIIHDFIQLFGDRDHYNEYFETALMNSLYNSNFELITQYKTVYGNGITDEAFITKTIHLGIRSEFYQGIKVFIKEFGNPLDYLDYFLLLESMKGTGKDEKIDEIIHSFMAFYF